MCLQMIHTAHMKGNRGKDDTKYTSCRQPAPFGNCRFLLSQHFCIAIFCDQLPILPLKQKHLSKLKHFMLTS